MPTTVLDTTGITTTSSDTVTTIQRIDGIERAHNPALDSGLQSILLVMLILVTFSFKHCYRLLSTFTDELFVVRRRINVFDDQTANETRIIILLVLQLCVYSGLLLMLHFNQGSVIPMTQILPATGILVGITATYYIFQLISYSVIGYTFTDPVSSRQWLKGFNASQALLSLALLPPTLVALFYPASISTMTVVAAGLYVLFRIAFIYKGFRIFYHNFSSLLYFILYLCTLEIIPVIFIYSSAQSLIYNIH